MNNVAVYFLLAASVLAAIGQYMQGDPTWIAWTLIIVIALCEVTPNRKNKRTEESK